MIRATAPAVSATRPRPNRTGRSAGTPALGVAPKLAAAVVLALLAGGTPARADSGAPPHSAELDAMIVRAAQRHGVPERLLRRIVMRESKYNPHARNHRYWGLMQISYPTAKSMGFQGSPEELLNPLTNLKYAVPYLANAFIAAGKREDAAVRLYASGYYDTARRRGILGLLRTADSEPVVAVPEPGEGVEAGASSGFGIFESLLGSSTQPDATPPAVSQVATLASGAPAAQAALPVGASPETGARSGALPQGRRTTGGVDLAADGSGRTRPPVKWLHDGGLTILAKGEQSGDSFAAARTAQGGEPGRASGRHPHKSAVFASLDAPGQTPTAAQAYAASASDATPAPQAAIAQALSASPDAQSSIYPTAPDAARQAAASTLDDGDVGKPRRRRASRRHGRQEAKRSETARTPRSEANAAPDAGTPSRQ